MNGFAEVSTMEMEMVDGGNWFTDLVKEIVKSGVLSAGYDLFKEAVNAAGEAISSMPKSPDPVDAITHG